MARNDGSRVVSFAFAVALLWAGASSAPRLAAQDADSGVGQGRSEIGPDWLASVDKTIQEMEYEITWQADVSAAGLPPAYQAPNRAQNLRTYFTQNGLVVAPRVASAQAVDPRTAPKPSDSWTWRTSLTGWGRAGAIEPLDSTVVSARGREVEYRSRAVIERFTNRERGLVHSLEILYASEETLGSGELVLRIESAGDLWPAVVGGGASVELRDRASSPVLGYRIIGARDASGLALNARLLGGGTATNGVTILLVIDDAAAAYPVTAELELKRMGTAPDWAMAVPQLNANFGSSVAGAGDVNCDGYDDVIIGAPLYDGGFNAEGLAVVCYGSPAGLPVGWVNWSQVGGVEGAFFGRSVAGAGDVNDDGCADVIVGAPYFDYGAVSEGAAWVWHGSPLGLEVAPANFDHGVQGGCNFGASVGSAGDVNGDGYDDVFVTASHYDNGEQNEGRVWVWHGSPTGISLLHNWRAESNQRNSGFGDEAASAGDVNGDGYDDLMSGAWLYDNGQVNEGMVFVWYGSSDGLNGGVNGNPANAVWSRDGNQAEGHFGSAIASAGDVNGDGFGDVIIAAIDYDNGQEDEGAAKLYHGSASGLSTYSDNHDEGNQAEAHFGSAVAGAGDVNNDGYDDIIVGASGYDTGYDDGGKVWVWYGSALGVSSLADWSSEVNSLWAHFGASAASAGDIEGDGWDDLIVGAPGLNNAGGMAFVFHGRSSRLFADGFETGDFGRWSSTVP